MAEDWREYQEEAAAFFRSIGMDAKVNESVEGARGTHDIDIWVTFSRYGLNFRWIVECKFWTSAIPKEKVLALYQIAQDIGADRAFLLSETGFQSGAIKVANNTNVTLTSLVDLRENAQDEIFDSALQTFNKHIASLDVRLNPLIFDNEGRPYKYPWSDFDETLSAMGASLFLKLALPKASLRKFPIHFPAMDDCHPVISPDMNTFMQNAAVALDELSAKVARLESMAHAAHTDCNELSQQFISAVEHLIQIAESALYTSDEDEQKLNEVRLQALEAMKAVSRMSQEVKTVAKGRVGSELSSLMQLLIDSVYLNLTKDTIPMDEWNQTKEAVVDRIERFRRVTVLPVIEHGH